MLGKTNAKAHRVAWALFHGVSLPPPTVLICHDCDNPICVEPKHLYDGTIADNNHDKKARNRDHKPRNVGESSGRSKLTEAAVRDVRKRFSAGESQRSLAAEYGVHSMQISRAVRRVTWRHVQ